MRLHPTRVVSSLLITAFISGHVTPAHALRPAGLEEQSDESKDEVVVRLTEPNAGVFPGGNRVPQPNDPILDDIQPGEYDPLDYLKDGKKTAGDSPAAGLEEGVVTAEGKVFTHLRGPARRVAFPRASDRPLMAVVHGTWVEVIDWLEEITTGKIADLKAPVLATTFRSRDDSAVLALTPGGAFTRNIHHQWLRRTRPDLKEREISFAVRLPAAERLLPHSLAFSPDRELLLVTGPEMEEARVQNLAPERSADYPADGIAARFRPQGEGDRPISGAYHPGGGVVAVGTSAGAVELLRLPARGEPGAPRLLARAADHGGAVRVPLFSPDGKLLATGDEAGHLRVWKWDAEAAALTPLHSFSTGDQNPLSTISFVPVRVWGEDEEGRPVRVQDDALSSRTVAAAGRDGRVYFFDAVGGRQGVILQPKEPAPILSISFSPDGSKVAAGRKNNTLAIWKVPAADWYARLAGRANGALTDQHLQRAGLAAETEGTEGPEDLTVVVTDGMDESLAGAPGVMDLSSLKGETKIEAIVDAFRAAPAGGILVVRSALQVDRALIDRLLPNLKGIVRAGHGFDNVDVEYAESKGVRVRVTKGSEREVAALACWMAARAQAVAMEAPAPAKNEMPPHLVQPSDWELAYQEKAGKQPADLQPLLRSKFDALFQPIAQSTLDGLRGKTLGVIGFGAVGKAIAAAAQGLGMEVVAYAPSLEADLAPAEALGVRFAPREEIERTSHYIVLATGLYKKGPRKNVGMVDAAAVGRMLEGKKENGNLIAVIDPDREGLVVEEQIVRLMQEGGVQFLTDEVPEDPYLREHAVFTPHIPASVPSAKKRVAANTATVLQELSAEIRQAGLEEGQLRRVVVLAAEAREMEALLGAVKYARPEIAAEGIANSGDVGYLIEKKPDAALVAGDVSFLRTDGKGPLSPMEAQPLADAVQRFEEAGIPVLFVAEPDTAAATLQELEADLRQALADGVRAIYGSAPYAVGLRVGGNNVSAGLVNAQGRVDTRLARETRWRSLPRVRELLGLDPDLSVPYADEQVNAEVLKLVPVPEQGVLLTPEQAARAGEIADLITRDAVRQIVDLVRLPGLPAENLKVIHIGIPSPVNSEAGVVGDPYPAANVPGFDHYAMGDRVREGVRAELGTDVKVLVENDAPSGFKGEKFGGAGKGFTRIATFIWGTGMNGSDHAGRWFELGHALVGRLKEDGKWHYELRDATQSRLELGLGELEVEQRLGGGAGLPKYWLAPAGFSSPQEVTEKARRGDANAIGLIREAGGEFGRAMSAVFAKDYQETQGVLERFIIVSGIGENLGLGVQDGQGRDLLVGAVQDGAREELVGRFGIPADVAGRMAEATVRSTWNADREIAAAAEGLQQFAGLEEPTVPQALKGIDDLPGILRKPDAPLKGVRPVLVDMSRDARVGQVAQALALVAAKYEGGDDLQFCVVATDAQRAALVAQLEPVNSLAAGLLRVPSRVALSRAEALEKLAGSVEAGQRLLQAGTLLDIDNLTEDLALVQRLIGHLKSYGLSFLDEPSFSEAFRALLRAA